MRIIFFDIDCLRPDHLGCYGYNRPTSPNIDRIAAEGVRFNNCYCSSSPCLPSRTAWVSGRFGCRNGVLSNHGRGAQFHLRCGKYNGPAYDNQMLPRKLRREGIDAISISNFADRHSAYYFMCGWSEFYSPNLKCGNETAQEVNEVALRWLKHNTGKDNYFLHINYWDPHRIYTVDKQWSQRFKDTPVEQKWPDEATIRNHYSKMTGSFTASQQFKDNRSNTPMMPDQIASRKDFEHLITGYDSCIAYTDYHIGQILQFLDETGQMDDTAIIISSDHGDAFGEHGIYSDHVCADECVHNIPLIVRWPGVSSPGISNHSLIYNLDLGPTLCELINCETPEDWDGKSFATFLRNDCAQERDYLVWNHGLYTVQRAVRTRSHLMIRSYHNYDYEGIFEPIALYDMQNDKYQTANIASSNKDTVSLCERHLNDWLATQMSKSPVNTDPLQEILVERTVL